VHTNYWVYPTLSESQDSSANLIFLKPVCRGDRSRGPVDCSDSIETIDLSGSCNGSMYTLIWRASHRQQEQYNEMSIIRGKQVG
jgi:hypothetical protein